MKLLIAAGSLFLLLLNFPIANAQSDSLDVYVNRLRSSLASGGSETSFMSIGSDFLYAQDYFEAGNFSSAAYNFQAILRREKDHPYANYQLAISLIKQKDEHKARQAEQLLVIAFSRVPSLKNRYAAEMPAAANVSATSINLANGLDSYIDKIKYSRSTGGAETVMNAPGLDAFYGIEYYELGDYRSAETNFSLSLAQDPQNPYVNYMKAVSLAAQGENNVARSFLEKAIAADTSLLARFAKEAPIAKARWQEKQDGNKVKASLATTIVYGGALVYGNYTCHQSVWNGPNVSPAYRYDYKGYFALKKDGTYRWLDDGSTGRYKYDAATGTITWLSGHLKTMAPKTSQYQKGTTVAQVTISYSDSYRWECGCKKK